MYFSLAVSSIWVRIYLWKWVDFKYNPHNGLFKNGCLYRFSEYHKVVQPSLRNLAAEAIRRDGDSGKRNKPLVSNHDHCCKVDLLLWEDDSFWTCSTEQMHRLKKRLYHSCIHTSNMSIPLYTSGSSCSRLQLLNIQTARKGADTDPLAVNETFVVEKRKKNTALWQWLTL